MTLLIAIGFFRHGLLNNSFQTIKKVKFSCLLTLLLLDLSNLSWEFRFSELDFFGDNVIDLDIKLFFGFSSVT